MNLIHQSFIKVYIKSTQFVKHTHITLAILSVSGNRSGIFPLAEVLKHSPQSFLLERQNIQRLQLPDAKNV